MSVSRWLFTFVNAVYLYDEKVLITFNYKDGTKTITFDEIAAKDAPEGNGSDLGCFAPPKNLNVCKYAEVFVLLQSQTHWAGGFEQLRRCRRRRRKNSPDGPSGSPGLLLYHDFVDVNIFVMPRKHHM